MVDNIILLFIVDYYHLV